MTVIYSPFKVTPVFLEKIWGGQALAHKLNKKIQPSCKIGESWEVSGEKPNQSIISTGKFQGMMLGDFCVNHGSYFLGLQDHITFPLLYKFIDANDKLSVQVHPDDFQAVTNGWGTRGKTECWYIVDAKPGATIIAGLKKNITKEEMRTAIADGTIRNLLKEEPVAAGDLFFIPAGTIHAIMADTLIYEVQESSDITFRVYDWDRLDDSGNPRGLHIEEAIEATDTKSYGSFRIKPVTTEHNGYTHSLRVACRYFALEQYSLINNYTLTLPVKKSFSVVTIIKGAASLDTTDSTRIVLNHGESACIPAMLNNCTVCATDHTEILVSSVPDLTNEIIMPLRKHGTPESAIIALGGIVHERNDILQASIP